MASEESDSYATDTESDDHEDIYDNEGQRESVNTWSLPNDSNRINRDNIMKNVQQSQSTGYFQQSKQPNALNQPGNIQYQPLQNHKQHYQHQQQQQQHSFVSNNMYNQPQNPQNFNLQQMSQSEMHLNANYQSHSQSHSQQYGSSQKQSPLKLTQSQSVNSNDPMIGIQDIYQSQARNYSGSSPYINCNAPQINNNLKLPYDPYLMQQHSRSENLLVANRQYPNQQSLAPPNNNYHQQQQTHQLPYDPSLMQQYSKSANNLMTSRNVYNQPSQMYNSNNQNNQFVSNNAINPNGWNSNQNTQNQWKRNGTNQFNQYQPMNNNQQFNTQNNGFGYNQSNNHQHNNGYNQYAHQSQPMNNQQFNAQQNMNGLGSNSNNNMNNYQNNGYNQQQKSSQAVVGRYQSFGTFDGSTLRVWIQNLNDSTIKYKNDFNQSSFSKLKIEYVAKMFMEYLQSKQPVSLSQSEGDIHLSIPSSDLPPFVLKLENKMKQNKMKYPQKSW